MSNEREQARLVAKPPSHFPWHADLGMEHLQRHRAGEPEDALDVRAIHCAKAPTAEDLVHAIVTDFTAS
jgi:hypothetical protein